MSVTPVSAQSLLLSLATQASTTNVDPLLNALAGTGAATTSVGNTSTIGDTVTISKEALALLEAQAAGASTLYSDLLTGSPASSGAAATPSASAAAASRLTATQAANVGAKLKAKEPALFNQFDTNGDGTLTASEIEAGLAAMEQQSAQMLVSMENDLG